MTRKSLTVPILMIVMGGSFYRTSLAQQGSPLQEVVAAINGEVHRYFTEQDSMRSEPLPEEKWPAPLTVEEVITAIRQFQPNSRGGEASFPIFESIAESQLLPPQARLHHHDQWFDKDFAKGEQETGQQDRYEYRHFKYQIDVWIPEEKAGYGLPIRLETLDRRMALRPSGGYTWVLNPRSLGTVRAGASVSTGDFVCSINEDKQGSLLAFTMHSLKEIHELRAIVFDDEFRRHTLQRRRLGAVNDTGMTQFHLPASDLPWSRIKYLGFEGVTEEGSKRVSELAVRQATEKGIAILPLPEEGEPYEFALTTSSGKRFDSQSLRGRVVLIDFWATWCGPCLRQLPELKKQYQKWHANGFEVIGVSFDNDAKVAESTYERLDVPWDLVVVPADADARRLWTEANRITTIPTVLLIDQTGVLRAQLTGSKQIESESDQHIRELFSIKE